MKSGRWTCVAVLAGCTVLLNARALPAANPPTPASAPADSGVHKDLQKLADSLESKTATQAQRDESARRLVSRRSDEARDILFRILRDGSVDSELAVARALGDEPKPDPRFIAPLAQLLGSERTQEAVSRALARYPDDAAQDRLIAFARDARPGARLRAITIRALGSVVEKRVASTLMDLLTDGNQGATIQNAAADALAEMTGLTDNGRDVQRWRQWAAANGNKPDADWKATVYATRSAHLDDVAQKYTRLSAELESILRERYQDARSKPDALMRYLNSTEPDVRAIGAKLVLESFLTGEGYPEAAPARLADLIGDSDVHVRLEVARTLKSINYAPALDAMLTQLAQEQDPDVKVALIGAVAQTGDLRVLPQLRTLIHDPLLRVATAAAEGFAPRGAAAGKALSKVLYDSNKALAMTVAEELWKAGEDRANEPGSADFRAAIVEAVAPLRDPDLVIPLSRLLAPEQSERLRAAALRALGELGDPQSEDAIKETLQAPEPGVRLEALDALGRVGNFGLDADALYYFFKPRTQEPDRSVQDRAWAVFQQLLPTASKQVLSNWTTNLSREPKHLLPVLLELDKKLAADKDVESLAESQQSTGDVFMKLDQPADAATYYQKAMDYWKSQHGDNQSISEGVIRSLMIAYLKSGEYDKAAQFAGETIANSKAQQSTMGPLIRDEVGSLIQTSEQKNDPAPLKSGLKLIEEALKIKPPLDDQYQDDLKRYQKDLQQRLAGQSPQQ